MEGDTIRLIDVDAFIEQIKKDPLFPLVEQYGLTCVIEAQPTVDAVPVVRCKDCCYSHHWYRDRRICELWDEETGVSVYDDGFCSYGKRRE